jgi:hypothetical protein
LVAPYLLALAGIDVLAGGYWAWKAELSALSVAVSLTVRTVLPSA